MSQRQAKRARQAARPTAPTPRPSAPRSRQGSRQGSRRNLWIAVASAAVVAVVAGGVLAARGRGPAAAVRVASGSGALQLSGTDPVTGRSISLTSYAGKPVVLNIWASWCPGCNKEAADLRSFAASHPEVQVIGIDIQDTKSGAKGFYRRWGWKHPSVFDPSGSISARFGLQGLPTTVFLDKQHRVVTQIVGASDLAGFNEGLRQAKQA